MRGDKEKGNRPMNDKVERLEKKGVQQKKVIMKIN